VGYVHEGFTLWFLCGLESQKAKNLTLDNRVSITIDHDTPDIMSITGCRWRASAPRGRSGRGGEGDRDDAAEVPRRAAQMAAMQMPRQTMSRSFASYRRSSPCSTTRRLCAHRPRDLLMGYRRRGAGVGRRREWAAGRD